jgi:hypothetical protein
VLKGHAVGMHKEDGAEHFKDLLLISFCKDVHGSMPFQQKKGQVKQTLILSDTHLVSEPLKIL